MGMETPEEGYLAKIIVSAGTKDVVIGKLVCIIVENAEDVAAFKDFQEGASLPPKPAAKAAKAPEPASAPAPPAAEAAAASSSSSSSSERIFASPLARALAAEKGIALASVSRGSGFEGSIVAQDIANVVVAPAPAPAAKAPVASVSAAQPAPTAAPVAGQKFTDLPVSNIRGVIAKRLLQSKQSIPHYYLSVIFYFPYNISLNM